MNAPANKSMVLNQNTKTALFSDVPPGEDAPAAIKLLNSKFTSFADALYSYTNADGFDDPKEKELDTAMVRAFCRALGHPYVTTKTENMVSSAHYFESDAWFYNYMDEAGYQRVGNGTFYKLDEHYRPIACLDVSRSAESNISVTALGSEQLVLEFRERAAVHLKTDLTIEKKPSYAEVVKGSGMAMMGGESLGCKMGKIENRRIALPEYYPYLDGGANALIKAFMESEESVLILIGPPGTGKSSLVAAGVESLDLLPIYAKNATAIMDKNFVNYVFKVSDDYMNKVAGTAAKARSDLFTETLTGEREYRHNNRLYPKKVEEETPSIPVIVVEDADLLLAPRSQGNVIMAELLNETDGIGSNITRKIIFTTNLANVSNIEEALMRAGRCYDVVHCRLLTPVEAIAARAASGLPPFETPPTKSISLADTLRKPRKRICISDGNAKPGFVG